MRQNYKIDNLMSRLQAYRNRVPTHIIQLLDVSSRITLFLVGQNGPLNFVFKDRLQNKYKTTIGADIRCSCSPNKNDHCIHSLYILLKIFKVSVENPIIWQAAYIDSELSDLLSGKHTVQTRRQLLIRPTFDMPIANQILPSDFFIKKQIKAKYQFKGSNKVQQMSLNEDSVCPICQEIMNKNMCLAYCKSSCGNNYHLQCLKVWISHKKNQQSKLTCPMCRQEFHYNILDQLKGEQIEFKKRQISKRNYNYKCSSCGLDNINKNVHKCLLCSQFELCYACYSNKKHIKHPFVTLNQNGQWEGASQRRPNQLKIKQFISSKHKQSKNKQILQKLRKIQGNPSLLIDYVASSYPYVSKYISENIDPYHKLDLNDQQMICQKCNSKRMIFLRRLACGHFIDHQCLKQNIRIKMFYCTQDGTRILKGYEDLINKQRELQFQKEKVQYNIDDQFNPRHFQIDDSQNLPIQYQSNPYNFVNYFQSVPQNRFRMEQQSSSLNQIVQSTRNISQNRREIKVSDALETRLKNIRNPQQRNFQVARPIINVSNIRKRTVISTNNRVPSRNNITQDRRHSLINPINPINPTITQGFNILFGNQSKRSNKKLPNIPLNKAARKSIISGNHIQKIQMTENKKSDIANNLIHQNNHIHSTINQSNQLLEDIIMRRWG